MAQTRLSIDFAAFNAKLKAVLGTGIGKAAIDGVGQAGLMIMSDAIMDMPAVPLGYTETGSINPGRLRSSGSVFVNRKLLSVSQNVGHGTPASTISRTGIKAGEQIEAIVAFNTPYATYQHEGSRRDGSHVIRRWSHPDAGPKFLESKLVQRKQQYMDIVGQVIREYLRG